MSYRILRFLFGLAVRTFFREISLENFERIPQAGPLLILPNHPNGLVDPFLIIVNLRRPVSLTAKSTLKKNPLLALLFRLGKVVALHRRQDEGEGADPAKNAEALAEARRRLAEGGAVCLFPEGISHSQPQIQPLKTGAARIALEYFDLDGNPGHLKIVPVGIDYLDKQGFRSSALVRAAEPIDLGDWRAENPDGDPRALMAEVEKRLRDNTLNFEKRKESVIIAFAAELLLTQGSEPVRISELGPEAPAFVAAAERLRERYEALKGGQQQKLEALGGRIRAYAARLKRLGIHPREVFVEIRLGAALLFCLREFGALIIGLPLALWGQAWHLPPYFACVALKNLAGRERDVRATFAIFGAVLVFPAWYLALSGLAFWRLPLGLAALFILSLPLAGFAGLKYRDHFAAVARRSLTFTRFVLNPALRRELVGEGRVILAQMTGLT